MNSSINLSILLLVASTPMFYVAGCGGTEVIDPGSTSAGSSTATTSASTSTGAGNSTTSTGTGGQGGAAPCAPGEVLCGDLCTKPLSDAAHCGACDHVCADGESCQGGTCAPSCTDGVKSGHETDVNCGGDACAACDDGKHCLKGADCKSGVCSGSVDPVCQAPACNDGFMNGSETDLDCGGACASPCADGQMCGVAGDCESGVCASEICQVPTCGDGVKNGGEPAMDCGAACALKCELGNPCVVGGDCQSKNCAMNLCAPGLLGVFAGARSAFSPVDGVFNPYPSRTWLNDPASGIKLGAIDTATPETLAPFKAFLLILDGEKLPLVPPSSDESQALKDFVLGGGGLDIFYGLSSSWPEGLHTAFGVKMFPRCVSPGTASPTAAFPDELGGDALKAPHGFVGSLFWNANCHEEMSIDVGGPAVPIITNEAMNPIHIEAAYIPPNALGPGSGPVLFFADFYWSYSSYINGSPEFEALFKNSIEYVLKH